MTVSKNLYEDNWRFLWGLCYRMTGNAADAEDIVQEVFVKAMGSPRLDSGRPLRSWLVRVAMNLSRDHLRKRRREGYTGPWLPSPLPTDEHPEFQDAAAASNDSPVARYDMIESVSLAFMLALEALTPTQRAVLLLRDVFDYTTPEAAELLGVTENTVRVTLHRARRLMRSYGKQRVRAAQAHRDKVKLALERFLDCLRRRDAQAIEQLLTEDVVLTSDGGGEVAALLSPMRGREKVLQLIARLNSLYANRTRATFRMLNGLRQDAWGISIRRDR
ncbi:MAG TPA: sigma-70 family RNA polymerase sigma factor [Blastocatellia bacterium]|nr:sigma-70 family RNA polymerase sigma factor [Blastocatellia bacterium]